MVLLLVGSHDYLVSECVHVALCQWNWLGQDIETGSHQVDKEDLVVLDHAEDPLIVVARLGRLEVDDDSD